MLRRHPLRPFSVASLPAAALLAVAIAAAPAITPAQKVCDSANEAVNNTYFVAASTWFCMKRTTAAPMTITAVEFNLLSIGPTTGVSVGIWSENGATGKPQSLLGSGAVTLVPNVPGYYGATLTTPVVLTAPGSYFVGVELIANVQPSIANGTLTPHWLNPTSGWSGPFNTGGWSFRIHCGVHAGGYVAYGTGQVGSGAAIPRATGLGFPNTGNRIRLLASNALGAATGAFAVGPRTSVALPPFGTLYVTPAIVLPVVSNGGAPGAGWAALDLVVPVNPSLNNQKLSWQVLVIDGGASAGLAHTQGVEITFGD